MSSNTQTVVAKPKNGEASSSDQATIATTAAPAASVGTGTAATAAVASETVIEAGRLEAVRATVRDFVKALRASHRAKWKMVAQVYAIFLELEQLDKAAVAQAVRKLGYKAEVATLDVALCAVQLCCHNASTDEAAKENPEPSTPVERKLAAEIATALRGLEAKEIKSAEEALAFLSSRGGVKGAADAAPKKSSKSSQAEELISRIMLGQSDYGRFALEGAPEKGFFVIVAQRDKNGETVAHSIVSDEKAIKSILKTAGRVEAEIQAETMAA